MTPIQKAIGIAGSQTKLAKMLSITSQAVSKWVAGHPLPVTRAVEIEAVLNSEITRQELRPDIFGEPENNGLNTGDISKEGNTNEESKPNTEARPVGTGVLYQNTIKQAASSAEHNGCSSVECDQCGCEDASSTRRRKVSQTELLVDSASLESERLG